MEKTGNLLGAGLTFGLVIALLSGCAGNTTVTQPAAKPEAVPQNTVKQAVVPESLSLSGKVVETMDAGGYTYVNLEKDGKRSWVALPGVKVNVGQEIEVRPGTQMGKFVSKTLNKTFDDILFSTGLVTDAKGSLPSPPLAADTKNTLPPGHPPMDAKPQGDLGQSTPEAKTLPKGHMSISEQPRKEVAVLSGKVLETMDSGGYTYINLESGGKNVWVAAPTMKVAVGQEIKLQSGHEMVNFKSKGLNRSFDSVIFSAGELPEKQ